MPNILQFESNIPFLDSVGDFTRIKSQCKMDTDNIQYILLDQSDAANSANANLVVFRMNLYYTEYKCDQFTNIDTQLKSFGWIDVIPKTWSGTSGGGAFNDGAVVYINPNTKFESLMFSDDGTVASIDGSFTTQDPSSILKIRAMNV